VITQRSEAAAGKDPLLAYRKSQPQSLAITALYRGFPASELPSLTRHDIDFRRTVPVRAGYAKNRESRTMLMTEVLTTTLKAVKLNNAVGEKVFAVVKVPLTAHFARHLTGRFI
jgi:integrase